MSGCIAGLSSDVAVVLLQITARNLAACATKPTQAEAKLLED